MDIRLDSFWLAVSIIAFTLDSFLAYCIQEHDGCQMSSSFANEKSIATGIHRTGKGRGLSDPSEQCI